MAGLCLSFGGEPKADYNNYNRVTADLSDDGSKHGKEKAMDPSELRERQAPIKQRYREAPESAVVRLKARGSLGEGIACKVETGRALAIAGLHPASGGSGLELCSGDMLLEALVACAGVTLKAVSTALGITLAKADILAEGDLDFRGTLGVAKDVAVGLSDIRLTFQIESDAAPEAVQKLITLTERYCVVLRTLQDQPKISVVVERG